MQKATLFGQVVIKPCFFNKNSLDKPYESGATKISVRDRAVHGVAKEASLTGMWLLHVLTN